ncbi:hypothetical protein AUR04nite_32950 [Glutamicibacter uratoxydans]|uniref:Uncharacterized protein n=1 Tax=Glutamicibacter uratoxydans TaxID=43667 RepID=A0A4Y4DSX4_GLUUR|nr:hypothetical protein [Glutamicibacter uratoxydans]GED07763.1 hypothetical protein AUR04nite_32950 [Glutamicibacter uratoxydans]
MSRNQIFAGLTGSVIAGLTIVVSLSPSFWVILLGSLLLITGFSVLSKLERSWGPTKSGSYHYVVPMVIGPALGGLLRGTQYAVWLGVPAGLLCGIAAYLLIIKSPPFAESDSDLEEDLLASSHTTSRF